MAPTMHIIRFIALFLKTKHRIIHGYGCVLRTNYFNACATQPVEHCIAFFLKKSFLGALNTQVALPTISCRH